MTLEFTKNAIKVLLLSVLSNPAYSVFAETNPIMVFCESNPNQQEIHILSKLEEITRLQPIDEPTKEYWFKLNRGESVTANETLRKSKFRSELKTVWDHILKKHDGEGLLQLDKSADCFTYTPTYNSSTIEFTVKDSENKELYTKKLIYGPEEHWYLSVDMVVSDINQVKYESQTNSIIEKEKPAKFYLGFNRKFGDVYESYSILDNVFIKGMISVSSTPMESVGLGFGYSFDLVDVFVARIRTRDDGSVAGADLGQSYDNVIGVSFDIAKGIAWLE